MARVETADTTRELSPRVFGSDSQAMCEMMMQPLSKPFRLLTATWPRLNVQVGQIASKRGRLPSVSTRGFRRLGHLIPAF